MMLVDYVLNVWYDEDTEEVFVDAYPVEDGDNGLIDIVSIILKDWEVARLNEDFELFNGDDVWVSLEQAPDWLKDKLHDAGL